MSAFGPEETPDSAVTSGTVSTCGATSASRSNATCAARTELETSEVVDRAKGFTVTVAAISGGSGRA